MIIPDKTEDKNEKLVHGYQQLRKRLRIMDDDYIDNTNNKQVIKEIRDILVIMGQMLKVMNGVQKDQDVDATT